MGDVYKVWEICNWERPQPLLPPPNEMMKPTPAEKGTNRKLLKSTFQLSSSYEVWLPRSESFRLAAS